VKKLAGAGAGGRGAGSGSHRNRFERRVEIPPLPVRSHALVIPGQGFLRAISRSYGLTKSDKELTNIESSDINRRKSTTVYIIRS